MTEPATHLDNCRICTGGDETQPIQTVRKSLPFALECNIEYFCDVMSAVSKLLVEFNTYTFVFTRSVDELPSQFYDKNRIIVFIMGDEWGRTPVYADRVHAIFKAPGQHIKLATHSGWPRFNAMAAVQYLRLQIKRFPKYTGRGDNVFAIPYGYYRLPKVETVTPIMDRTLDASFTGSMDHRRAGGMLNWLIKTNKVLSRERMVDVVTRWKRGTPYTIDVKLSAYFPKAKDKPEFDDYPNTLMNTKICLSPRGTHLETYRLCEGMYYGCVVISEEQPDHWFAASSPAIIIRDWNTLPALLDSLLNDPQQLQQLQRESLDYWHNTLAPEPIAQYICEQLKTLSNHSQTTDHNSDQSSHFDRAA